MNYKNQFNAIMSSINNDYNDMDRARDAAYAEQAKLYSAHRAAIEGYNEGIINAISETVYRDVMASLDIGHYARRHNIGFH